ncbi:MAG: hypothetical protein E6G29_02190 [Actinobacteria bacterium]|nr:MAG: hypothetical protein E6G29_02190 [Actinomycetota bacterium]
MRRAAGIALVAGALGLAGCGGTAGDLLALEISGGAGNVHDQLRITDDGRASCNGGRLVTIENQQLLAAREDKRLLRPLAKKAATFPGAIAGARGFVARSQDGTVSWSEGAPRLPTAIGRATLLAIELERQLCR